MRTHPSDTRCRISSFVISGKDTPSGNACSVGYATSSRGDVVRDTYLMTAHRKENGENYYKWVIAVRGGIK